MSEQLRRIDVFISYSSVDHISAEQLYDILTPHVSVFLDTRNLRLGDHWQRELARAQQRSTISVLLVSDDMDPIFYSREEVAAAIALSRHRAGRHRVVPLYLSEKSATRDSVPYGLRESHGIVLGPTLSLQDAADSIRQLVRDNADPADRTTEPEPSGRPRVSNLPISRSSYFTGREEVLEELNRRGSDEAHMATVVVSGFGGIGKTQLVLEFAHRNQEQFAIVWWVRAEDEEVLIRDLAALAPHLKIPLDQAVEVTATAVRDYLSVFDERWLLVLDNATGPEAVSRWLPESTYGQVLITSRSRDWRGMGVLLDIDTLDRETAAQFLLHRTGRTDSQGALLLADLLGGHPLSLELASAYMNETSEAFEQYARKLSNLEIPERATSQRSHSIIEATLESTLRSAEHLCPDSVVLLERVSFLASEAVPLWILEGELEPLWLPSRIARAVDTLAKHALLHNGGSSMISVHPLVQTLARSRMTTSTMQQRIDETLTLLLEAFPIDPTDPDVWPVGKELMSHVLAAAGFAVELSSSLGLQLINRAAVFATSQGNPSEAEAVLRFAVEGARKVLGEEHPETLASTCNLAGTLRAMGEFVEARRLLEDALEKQQRVIGNEHPDTLVSMSNLASTLRAMGELSSARGLQESVLEIHQRYHGQDHPATLTAMNNLAATLRSMGSLLEARVLQEQVLSLRQRVLGEDHPETLTSMSNLAGTMRALGFLPAARELQENALKRYQELVGDDHPDTLIAMNNLAGTLLTQGEIDEARSLYEQALAAHLSQLGPDHPETLVTMNNLALAHEALGDFATARRFHEQALEAYRRVLGAEHPSTLASMNNLAEVLRRMHELDRAHTLHSEVLDVLERTLGRPHPATLTSMNNLASTLYAMGKLEPARTLFTQTLETRQRILGEQHPDTRATAANLATITNDTND